MRRSKRSSGTTAFGAGSIGSRLMRILFTANLPLFPALGGAAKVNRALLEGFSRKGHEVRAVVPMAADGGEDARALERLAESGASIVRGDSSYVVSGRGLELHLVVGATRLRPYLVDQIRRKPFDWIVVTSEDSSQRLLSAAVSEAADKTCYLVLTTSSLPFGPQSFFPGADRTAWIGRARRRIVMSDYLRRYIEEYSGFSSVVVRMPLYETFDGDLVARFDSGYVLMVNPCGIKGLPIFCGLAASFPHLPFATVPTWGTTSRDLAQLSSLPNVTLLEADEQIDRIYAQTRVLVMPSLWGEAFGLTCVEAMLRGIPVLASDVGGLPEAKLGTDYVLPVNPVERFGEELDERLIAEAIIPPQNLEPWVEALRRITHDREEYERQSVLAQRAAREYVRNATVDRFIEQLSTESHV
jgi:glycosyltransferase involved in cell wall biosynthesis